MLILVIPNITDEENQIKKISRRVREKTVMSHSNSLYCISEHNQICLR